MSETQVAENSIELGEEKVLSISQPELLAVATDTEEDTHLVDPVWEPAPSPVSDKGLFPLNDEIHSYLTREYLIANDSLVEDETKVFYPMNYFLGMQSESQFKMVRQILLRFTYFRADLRIRIQVVSPALFYGMILGYNEPIDIHNEAFFPEAGAGGNEIERWKSFSQINGYILSLEEQESIEFVLPWPYPGTSFCFPEQTAINRGSFANEIWKLHMHCPYVRQVADQAASGVGVGVLIYAKLENVVLTGPTSAAYVEGGSYEPLDPGPQPTTPVPSSFDETNPKEVVSQMRPTPGQGSGNSIQRFAGTAYQLATMVMNGADAIDKAGGPIMAEFMGYQAQQKLESMYENKTPKGPTQGNERSGVKQSVYGNTASFAPSPSFMNLGDHENTGVVSPAYVGLSSDIPHDFAHLIRRWQAFRVGAFTSGSVERLYACPQTSQKPLTHTDPDIFGLWEHGYLQFSLRFYRLWRGSMKYRFEFFGSPLIVAKFLVNIYWTRSSYTNSLVISDAPDEQEEQEKAGDIYSETFSVKGHTTINITVPYVKPNPWTEVNIVDKFTPIMTIRALTVRPTVSGSNTVAIPYCAYLCAGDDFQLRGYTGGGMVEIDDTLESQVAPKDLRQTRIEEFLAQKKAERQKRILTSHGKTTDKEELPEGFETVKIKTVTSQGLVNGPKDDNDAEPVKFSIGGSPLCGEESETNFYALLRRPGIDKGTFPSQPAQYPGLNSITTTARLDMWNRSRAIDKLGTCFLFWRGSMRSKMLFRDDEMNRYDQLRVGMSVRSEKFMNNPNQPDTSEQLKMEYGALATEPSLWPVVEVEIPYYAQYFASRTMTRKRAGNRPAYELQMVEAPVSWTISHDTDSSPVPDTCYTSIGDDFRFYGILPAPRVPLFKLYGLTAFTADPPFLHGAPVDYSEWENSVGSKQ